MVNVLIADDNVNYAVNLMNYINKNIRISMIAKDGKEALDLLCAENNIDVILLDLKMPIFSGVDVLELIKNQKKYENAIIILSGELNYTTNLNKYNNLIYSVIDKVIGLDIITLKINSIIEEKEKIKKSRIIRNKVIEELVYLGYDISHKGSQYLIKVIEYIVSNSDKDIENLERDVYPQISLLCNTSIHNIKCRINKSTTEMYYNCNIEKLKKYFKFDEDVKPKVKTIIYTIINKIL